MSDPGEAKRYYEQVLTHGLSQDVDDLAETVLDDIMGYK